MRNAHKSARYAVGVLLAATAVAASACSSSSSSSSTTAGAASSAATGGAAGGASAAGSVTNVTLGYVPYSDDASLFYAQSSGIFKKHGLNVTFVPQASPVAVEASMASGTEQFGFITTPIECPNSPSLTRSMPVSRLAGDHVRHPRAQLAQVHHRHQWTYRCSGATHLQVVHAFLKQLTDRYAQMH
jgi:hypothetical protein